MNKRNMILNAIKRLTIKLVVAFLTFFIGVSVVSFWYLSRFDAESERAVSDAMSAVLPGIFTFENPCGFPRPHHRELWPEEAVYLAECFVIQNGYTDQPPIADRTKLTPESLYGFTDDEGMKFRYDSLVGKAHSYYFRKENDRSNWVVIFRYKLLPRFVEFHGKRFGRAVSMDVNGKRMRIEHEDILNEPEARIIDP